MRGGLGFRVWSPAEKRFRVSGFGFRLARPESSLRVSFRFSGFGFRVLSLEASSPDLSPDHVSILQCKSSGYRGTCSCGLGREGATHSAGRGPEVAFMAITCCNHDSTAYKLG